MKKFLLPFIASIAFINLSYGKTMLPNAVTNDLLKVASVELLIHNIEELYKVTNLEAARIVDEGVEIAGAFLTIVKADNVCMQVAAIVSADTCTHLLDRCELGAYALDCDENQTNLATIMKEKDVTFYLHIRQLLKR